MILSKKNLIRYYFILLILFLFSALFFSYSYFKVSKNLSYKNPLVEGRGETFIKVYLTEGFENPGLYFVKNNTTFADILASYPNTFDHTEQKNFNLNKVLTDGEVVSLKNTKVLSSQTSTPTENKVNINNANKGELMKVSGIGDKTSDLILSYLKENSGASVNDLIQIPGIGEKTLEKLKEYFY